MQFGRVNFEEARRVEDGGTRFEVCMGGGSIGGR